MQRDLFAAILERIQWFGVSPTVGAVWLMLQPREALDLVLAFIQLRGHVLKLRGPHDDDGQPIDYTMSFTRPDHHTWKLACVMIAERAFYRYVFTVNKKGELAASRGQLLMLAQRYR